MERIFGPVSSPPRLSVSAVDIGFADELTRSNSDASSLTAESCANILLLPPDDGTTWTDEKHSSYLNHLEVSFVKQLHRSKGLLEQCSVENRGEKKISEKQLKVEGASEQFTVSRNGCLEKISYESSVPLSQSSADSSIPGRPCLHPFKRKGMLSSLPSDDTTDSLKPRGADKHEKDTISHGLAACSHEFCTNNPYDDDLFDLTREASGQNFLDENYQRTSNLESQAKRSKPALADSLNHDQIVPFRKCPADYSVIKNSTLGEELARQYDQEH